MGPYKQNHYNKILKNDAWNEIASEFSNQISTAITPDECRNKMVSIQAAHRREKMKIRKSVGTGSGKSILPKLNYFLVKH